MIFLFQGDLGIAHQYLAQATECLTQAVNLALSKGLTVSTVLNISTGTLYDHTCTWAVLHLHSGYPWCIVGLLLHRKNPPFSLSKFITGSHSMTTCMYKSIITIRTVFMETRFHTCSINSQKTAGMASLELVECVGQLDPGLSTQYLSLYQSCFASEYLEGK